MKVTRSSKLRDASGLGYLASALIEGDTAVLNGTTDDKHVRIIADAINATRCFLAVDCRSEKVG